MKLTLRPKFLRRTNTRTALIAAAVVAVFAICIGLFVKSYHDSGPTKPAAAGGSGTSDGLTGYPTDSGLVTSPGFFPTAATNITLPGRTIVGIVGGGLTFTPASQHVVVLHAWSATPIVRVGYLAPTAVDYSYGDVRHVGNDWTLTLHALGKPAYAIIYIQAGPAGIPINCSISVDGHIDNTSNTQGPYGRTICLG